MLKILNLTFLFLSTFFINAQTNEILGQELDVFIQQQMSQQSFIGLSACIVKGDQVVWKAAYGLANIATNTPVSTETEFTLASISKLFTATACAQLWEAGTLNLDANINDYLPITVINPNFSDVPITTRQLLKHESSLHDSEADLQLWDAVGDPIYDLDEFCEIYFLEGGDLYLASNFGNTAPGASSYWYSNAGFTLLGYIVESASGMPFNEYVRENILEPLEMNTAGWFYSEVDLDDMAMPYNGAGQPYGYFSVPEYPAAMLKSNVEELANFLIAYTQKGIFQGTVLVNEDTFNSLVPESMTDGFGWWGTDTWWGDSAGNFWSHGGFMNGVRTQLNYYPTDSTGLIILTNGQGNYQAIQNKLEEYIPLFEIENTTATFDIETVDFNVFPNPVDGQETLHFEFHTRQSSLKQVEIYNLNGQFVLKKRTLENSFLMDISTLLKGIYWVGILKNGSRGWEKIVVN
ncbi:MAG: CubicO group peptidase (beta-lactamase class C family) [Paraglaciecola sp.]|jgi:CubicO group peptidase (beta-lactamase class C family)